MIMTSEILKSLLSRERLVRLFLLFRCIGPGCGPDFNPALLGGTRGYPGIRARMNARMFQYASQLVGELLNKEIQRARLPDITQSTQPMVREYSRLSLIYPLIYQEMPLVMQRV